jgi:hypothetical protein
LALFPLFQIVDYFSYEHFYVIYCKFWELDTDHDLLIDEKDLAKHNNHGIYTKPVVLGLYFLESVLKASHNIYHKNKHWVL